MDVNINILGLGKHRDGGSGSVNAAVCFCLRDALNSVHAGFKFQPREHIPTTNLCARLLEAAYARLGKIEDFEPPSPQFGVFLVHPKQFGGKQRRFLSTCAGADLEYRIALIVRILWE